MGITTPEIDAAAIKLLLQHPFPGNVRELKNVIERALIESGGQPVQSHHIYLGNAMPIRAEVAAPADSPVAAGLPLNLEAAENLLIKRALAETAGNIAEAARRLGINRTRIYRKLGEQGSFSLTSPENPQ
jgi:DNA-binding NtrC family response regulator